MIKSIVSMIHNIMFGEIQWIKIAIKATCTADKSSCGKHLTSASSCINDEVSKHREGITFCHEIFPDSFISEYPKLVFIAFFSREWGWIFLKFIEIISANN